MTSVFVGGSRKVSRLSVDLRRRLDQIIDKKLHVLLGDANGADKAVQAYLKERSYPNVVVFCTGGECR
ncbi:MAG TPA: putative addiction module antidote protein, partial [Thermoanaerobaculia bacterium]|nr:putative addiction module antidote protein [Thermoanaerobaculia bacterium]